MSDKYRIDPNFVVPEPTAANMFSFCELDKFGDEEMKRQCDWMREAGAQQMRVTIVSDEYPNEPYPHGYWFEGWTDKHARQLPFGEGCSPPLTAIPPASAIEAPSGVETGNTDSTEGESAAPSGETHND